MTVILLKYCTSAVSSRMYLLRFDLPTDLYEHPYCNKYTFNTGAVTPSTQCTKSVFVLTEFPWNYDFDCVL
ncbi:UNVERIFIED_CONTAM: hypothetical protein NCL1_60560 [Trichonephila clavipes]